MKKRDKEGSRTKTQTLFPVSLNTMKQASICSPPELLLSLPVGSRAADKEGVIQGFGHFFMQLHLSVQAVHTGQQLVEPMPQNCFAAR